MRSFILFCTLVMAAGPAWAQTIPPFFGGGVVAFDPEIAVASSGAVVSAGPVVSADRKYVTLGMQATNQKLVSLVPFQVSAIVPQGFVGGVALPSGAAIGTSMPGAASAPNAGAANAAVAAPSPDQISRTAKSWIFTRQGMFLVAPLQ